MRNVVALAACAGLAALAGPFAAHEARAQQTEMVLGITTFLSGPASVFGQPGKAAAEILIDEINAAGGLKGMTVRPVFIDEGAGNETLLSEYRRVVQEQGATVMLGAISSGSCNALAPLAEDLKVVNIMWDCGTQRILEERDYKYVFRTQANATAEMVATVLYLLKAKPDFKTIAVVNQDYAWGRDSWAIFSAALKALKPDVQVVAELFPKFGAPDYSTEVTRLSAMRPDVILSTSWGGDLDTFVRQAASRGLLSRSTFVLPLAESSLQRLGEVLPAGVIVGARGDHWFQHPVHKDDPAHKAFVEKYKAKTGEYPIYPVYHMAQAIRGLKAAFEKVPGSGMPTAEALAAAFEGLEFQAFGNPIRIREDNQGLEDQLLGVTRKTDAYPFPILDQMAIYPGALVTAPVGTRSEDWVSKLDKGLLDSPQVKTYKAGG